MADHGSSTTNPEHFQAARATYESFLKGAVALGIMCLYVLVALVAFAFVAKGNVLLGFAGLIIGILALIVDIRAGNNWYISVGWLVLFGLFTAIMVS